MRDEVPTVIHRQRPAGLVKERRACVRLPIELDIDVEGAAQRFRTTTADLSAGGVFLATNRDIPIGTHVMLSFTLPNGAAHEVIGVVQWRREGHDAPSQPGLGVAFFCLDPAAKQAIEAFCSVREALYADSGEFEAVHAGEEE